MDKDYMRVYMEKYNRKIRINSAIEKLNRLIQKYNDDKEKDEDKFCIEINEEKLLKRFE